MNYRIYMKYLCFLLILIDSGRLCAITCEDKVKERKSVIISCHNDQLPDGTVVSLRIDGDVLGAYGKEKVVDFSANEGLAIYKNTITKCIIKNHSFKLKMQGIKSPKYAVLYADNHTVNQLIQCFFIIENDDSILIKGNNEGLLFFGTNADKYSLQYRLFRIEHQPFAYEPENNDKVLLYFRALDSLAEESSKLLESYKPKISYSTYCLLKGDILCWFQGNKYQYLYSHGATVIGSTFIKQYQHLLGNYSSPLWNAGIQGQMDSIAILKHSLRWLDFILNQYKYDSCILLDRRFEVKNYFNFLVGQYAGLEREWLIYNLIENSFRDVSDELSDCIKKSLRYNYITNPSIREYFIGIENTFAVGRPGIIFLCPTQQEN